MDDCAAGKAHRLHGCIGRSEHKPKHRAFYKILGFTCSICAGRKSRAFNSERLSDNPDTPRAEAGRPLEDIDPVIREWLIDFENG